MADPRLGRLRVEAQRLFRHRQGFVEALARRRAPAHSCCARCTNPGLSSRLRRYSRSAPFQSQSYRNLMSPNAACASALSVAVRKCLPDLRERRIRASLWVETRWSRQAAGTPSPPPACAARVARIDFDTHARTLRGARRAGSGPYLARCSRPWRYASSAAGFVDRDLREARLLVARHRSVHRAGQGARGIRQQRRDFTARLARMTPDHNVAPLPAAMSLASSAHVSASGLPPAQRALEHGIDAEQPRDFAPAVAWFL